MDEPSATGCSVPPAGAETVLLSYAAALSDRGRVRHRERTDSRATPTDTRAAARRTAQCGRPPGLPEPDLRRPPDGP